MNAFINGLRTRLQEELLPIRQQAGLSLLAGTEKTITVLQSCLQHINEHLDSYQFKTPGEEIDFFKNILPEFQSQLIYHVSLSTIERRRPEGAKEVLERYYSAHRNRITTYFQEHKDFYEYYRAGCTHLDQQYFLRSSDDFSLVREAFSFVIDRRYCTTGSFIVSTILANRSLQQFLDGQVGEIRGHAASAGEKDYGLKWTDTRAALEEITYAFYFKGSFNNGQVEIRQLYEGLCSYFGVTPGNIYKSKQDFYGRSNLAAYQDILRKRYKDGMEDSDERYSRR